MHNLMLLAPICLAGIIAFKANSVSITMLIGIIITVFAYLFFKIIIIKKYPLQKTVIYYVDTLLLVTSGPIATLVLLKEIPTSAIVVTLIFLFYGICRLLLINIELLQISQKKYEKLTIFFGYSFMLPFILVLIGQYTKLFPNLTAIIFFAYFLDSRFLRDLRMSKNILESGFRNRLDRFILIFGIFLTAGWFELT